MIPGLTSKISESVAAVAASLFPKTDLLRVTGTGTNVDTIVPPYAGFSGILFLVADNAAGITLSTAGNILVGATLTQNRLYVLVYSKLSNKWYIHSVA
jgi:hypothetical protein